MPSYRGVEQGELVDSIDRAAAFLGGLKLGTVTGFMLPKLFGQNRMTEIAMAETDEELAYAINDTNIGFTLTMFSRVLQFHAVADPTPADGKSEARDIYSRLMSWGAFPPGEFSVTSGMDREFDAHLLPAYINALTDEDEEPDSEAQKRFKGFLDDLQESEDNPQGRAEVAKWLSESVPLIVSLTKMGVSKDEIKQITQGNPAGAAIVPRAVEAMLNLQQRLADLQIENPVAQYRVSLGKVPDDEEKTDAVFAPILEEIQDVMQPYLRKDEMVPRMMTYVDEDKDEGHIFVYATREAAEFLAYNLPEDMDVFDSKGRPVEPRMTLPPQPNLPPAPGFNI